METGMILGLVRSCHLRILSHEYLYQLCMGTSEIVQ